MNVIVDTHAIIWYITDDTQLPSASKRVIDDRENACFVSIASLWEIGVKYSLGKLELRAELGKIFQLIFDSGYLLLPITPEHIITNSSLPFHHRDPFDRLIIAQAKQEGMSIISKDQNFQEYGVHLHWDE